MTGVWITLAIGALIIIADWHIATKPGEMDKIKGRKPLSAPDKQSLQGLIVGTLVAAGAVWLLGKFWD